MNTIVVNQVQSNKSENMVWVVSIEGIEGSRQYCKSPRSAMKYMFLLKTRTGVRISKEGLQMLSAEIAKQKNFVVYTNEGQFNFDKLILCCGSKSYASTGSDGSGYTLAKKFGHNIINF